MEDTSGYDVTPSEFEYLLALEIFKITKSFPKEEKYSLTDQKIKRDESKRTF